MADCAAIPSCTHAPSRGSWSRSVDFWSSRRKCSLSFGNAYLRQQTSALKVQVVSTPFYTALRGKQMPKKRFLSCCCLGALIDPENIAPASLASYVDEALLVVSVIFAYMAGAIPQKRAATGNRSNTIDQNRVAPSTIPYGRSFKEDVKSKSSDSWSEVEGKVLDALDASECDDSFSTKVVGPEIQSKACPLSLFALAEGPRLRLLLGTLRQLQKEAGIVSSTF